MPGIERDRCAAWKITGASRYFNEPSALRQAGHVAAGLQRDRVCAARADADGREQGHCLARDPGRKRNPAGRIGGRQDWQHVAMQPDQAGNRVAG